MQMVILGLMTIAATPQRDTHSSANPEHVRMSHVSLDLTVDSAGTGVASASAEIPATRPWGSNIWVFADGIGLWVAAGAATDVQIRARGMRHAGYEGAFRDALRTARAT